MHNYSIEIRTRCSFVIEFIIPKFFWRLNMFRAAYRSSSGALNCIFNLWFICPYGDRPLPRLSGNNKFYYKAASCWYFYWVIYDARIHEYQIVAQCYYQLLFRNVSSSVLGHLQGARNFFDVCSLYVNIFGRSSTYMIRIIHIIKVVKSLKFTYTM